MGRLKEWNELLARTVFGEEFEAVLDEAKHEEPEGVPGEEVYAQWHETPLIVPEEKLTRRIGQSTAETDTDKQLIGAMEGLDNYGAGLIDAIEELCKRMQDSPGLEGYEDLLLEENAFAEWETLGQRQAEAWQLTGEAVREAEAAELWDKGDIKLTHDMTERILNGAVRREEKAEKSGVRKVKMSDSVQSEAMIVDDMLDEMTARLCDMMKKGADGIYW